MMDYYVSKIGLEGKGRQVFQYWQQYMEYYIMNMEGKQIDAILSDYDGTLCPTTSVRGGSRYDVGMIPKGLGQILFQISDRIPVCIVSSKDFEFLHNRARFASILSCVLGLETINHRPHNNDADNNDLGCVTHQHLIADSHSLKNNSKLLHSVLETLQNYDPMHIIIEEKYTSDKETLIGLTIDYRHLENWQLFKENTEPIIRDMIQKSVNANTQNMSSKDRPFIQTYSRHPFLDVYGIKCNKGLAFDNVLSQLAEKRRTNVIYFGDSENDNPAFRKSDISIGIRSDTRLKPALDCKYMLDFNQLPLFLRGLIDNDFIFSENLLPSQAD
jgi:hydroxymethylpyrimidine pyrophosphatase-like HAD family hydrolase